MLQGIWGQFGELHRLLLIGCALIIVLGGAILLVDRYFIREPALPREQALPPIADALGLELELESADRPLLLEVLKGLPEIAGEVRSIGATMRRADSTHRLWVFEFKARNVVLLSPNPHTPLLPQTADITRLGIVLELAGSQLPTWHQQMPGLPPAPPWTEAARARLQAIEDLWFGFSGRYVLAVARPDRFALKELVDSQTSPDFHPGLRNSALAIDVQRVLDVVNRLDTGAAELARVYRIDVDVKLPPVRELDLTSGLSEIAREQAEASAQRQQRYAEQQAQFRAQLEADNARREQARQAAAEAAQLRSEQSRADREAQRQAQAERNAEALERIRQRAAAAQERPARDASE
jgi:hypothetical protein